MGQREDAEEVLGQHRDRLNVDRHDAAEAYGRMASVLAGAVGPQPGPQPGMHRERPWRLVQCRTEACELYLAARLALARRLARAAAHFGLPHTPFGIAVRRIEVGQLIGPLDVMMEGFTISAPRPATKCTCGVDGPNAGMAHLPSCPAYRWSVR